MHLKYYKVINKKQIIAGECTYLKMNLLIYYLFTVYNKTYFVKTIKF